MSGFLAIQPPAKGFFDSLVGLLVDVLSNCIDMMVTEVIRRRYSCRIYEKKPLAASLRQTLNEQFAIPRQGPFGSQAHFALVAATEQDREALKGLGTYGFIRNAPAFVLGVINDTPKNLEDYGYLLEQIVLIVTEANLGTCWLGGTFTQSNFATKISHQPQEIMPAVLAIGYAADHGTNYVRKRVGGDTRLEWQDLFYEGEFGKPLTKERAGAYSEVLEMVRWGPSGSNKQPWRIIKTGSDLHLYIQRTPGYQQGWFLTLLHTVDIQRLDSGIAMCHFEMAAHAIGLAGQWVIQEPSIAKPDALTEYVVSWHSDG